MSASGLHISISAEPIFAVGGFQVTNSIFTSIIVSTLLILFAVAVRAQISQTARPSGLQNFAEWVVESFYSLLFSVTGDHKKARLFMPFIASVFLFIMLNNYFGLLPGVGTIGKRVPVTSGEEHAATPVQQPLIGVAQAATQESIDAELSEDVAAQETEDTHVTTEEINLQEDVHALEETSLVDSEHEEEAPTSKFVPFFRPGTADLNTTLALALMSVALTQFYGFHFQKLGYFKKFINFSSPIMFAVGLLEIVSEVAKIISFAFRLFGNIFAGEVLLVVTGFLVPLVVPMPFYGLELFVGFVQALVFAMLSLVFFNMAAESHDEH